MTRYFLGVDGGGTNCRIRLADESLTTLGEGRGGPSNLQILNGEPAYRSILSGTEAAFAAAGLGSDAYSKTYACFCMAGGRSVTDRDAFARRCGQEALKEPVEWLSRRSLRRGAKRACDAR